MNGKLQMICAEMPERRQMRERYAEAVAAMKWPSMLTLRRPNFNGRLTTARLRETMRAFARMRRYKAFRAVKGGVAAIDTSNRGNGWHEHIHAIIDAKWIDIPAMAEAWSRALREPGNIHVERLKDPKKALAYITKPQHVEYRPGETAAASNLVDELDAATRAPYLSTAWGTCHRRPAAGARIDAP